MTSIAFGEYLIEAKSSLRAQFSHKFLGVPCKTSPLVLWFIKAKAITKSPENIISAVQADWSDLMKNF